MSITQVTTVSDFESLLKKVANEQEDFQLKDIDLTKLYPVLGLKLSGDEERLNGQLTSTICKGLTEFHLDLQKAYCIVRYNTDNLQKLRSKDKKQLEVIFKVESGCTNIIADITALLESLKDVVHKATDNMTGRQKTAFFISIVFSIGGAYTFSTYADLQKAELASNQEIKLAELNKGQIDTFTDTLFKIVQESNLASEKQLRVNEQIAKGYQGLIKTALLSGANTFEFTGVNTASLDQTAAQDLITNNQPTLETIEANYGLEISSIKRTADDNLTITASLEGSDETFNVAVNTTFIEQSEVDMLFEGFKNNQLVYVEGSYKIRSGVIEKANASSISLTQPAS
ncbi:hypothetical protein [Vibrio cholerae]|uniref:hypothetical protein n=1 Tax=Vibrio cholerae TaxID=666 RepID=UPI0000EF91F1|nr:hypothetical protein [Vibrio cholerae]KNH57913.1 hypothetical protein A55_1602 [Vibrio cholerae 1587]